MTDSIPSAGNLFQQENIEALKSLRYELEDYLATLERNTAAAKEWLITNKDLIIEHHLNLAIKLRAKDTEGAVAALTAAGKAGGFILSFQDVRDLALALEPDNAYAQAAAQITPGIPRGLQEPLPAISDENRRILARVTAEISQMPPEVKEKLEEKKTKSAWYNPASWFNKEERQQEAGLRTFHDDLVKAKNEVLGTYAHKHYYVDSYMDWVADTLAPQEFDDNGLPKNIDSKLTAYKDPSYAIHLAEESYHEVVEKGAEVLRSIATTYSDLVDAFENGHDAKDVIVRVKQALYPVDNAENATFLKKLILQRYNCQSLGMLAIAQSRTGKVRDGLLSLFLMQDEPLTGQKETRTRQDAFADFFFLALEKKEPLHPALLFEITRSLDLTPEEVITSTLSFSGSKNVFQHIMESDKSAADQKTLLDTVLAAMSLPLGLANKISECYASLNEAIESRSWHKRLDSLFEIMEQGLGAHVLSLWKICHPHADLLKELLRLNGPLGAPEIIDLALDTGLVEDVPLKHLMKNHVLGNLDTFPIDTARRLIAHFLSKNVTEALHGEMILSEGWIAQVAESKTIGDTRKMQWLAALLEPFPSDIARANILHRAAFRAHNKETSKYLTKLERSLVGNSVRLSDGSLLFNPSAVANIWYRAEEKQINCIDGSGLGGTLLKDVSAEDAMGILELISRRHKFTTEENGLFQPHLISKTWSREGKDGVLACWQRESGWLNPSKPDLMAMEYGAWRGGDGTRFISLKNDKNETIGFNVDDICLLQITTVGTLVLDKYGNVHHLLEMNAPWRIEEPLHSVGFNSWFNPAHASIIAIDKQQSRLEIRVESTDFDNNIAGEDRHFYQVALPRHANLDNIENAVLADGDAYVYGGGFCFNLKAMGFMSLIVPDSAQDFDELPGYECQPAVSDGTAHFIEADVSILDDVLENAKSNMSVLRLGSYLIHRDNVEAVIADPGNEQVRLMIKGEMLDFDLPSTEITNLIRLLQEEKGFISVNNAPDSADAITPNQVFLDPKKTVSFAGLPDSKKVQAAINGRIVSASVNNTSGFLDAMEARGNGFAPNPFSVKLALQKHLTLEKLPSPINSSDTKSLLQMLLCTATGRNGETFSYPKARSSLRNSSFIGKEAGTPASVPNKQVKPLPPKM